MWGTPIAAAWISSGLAAAQTAAARPSDSMKFGGNAADALALSGRLADLFAAVSRRGKDTGLPAYGDAKVGGMAEIPADR